MTTLREAAQQALEALDEADTFHRNLPDQRARRLAAMAALRAALAQQVEPLNLRDPAVQKRLATQWGYVPAAQAEPVEPVAQFDLNTMPGQADAHLRALLRYTENFYATAIEHGMRAGPTANAIAHVERAGKALHQIVHAQAKMLEPARPVAWNWMLDGQPYGQAYYGRPPDADIVESLRLREDRAVRLLYTAPPQRKLVPLTEAEIEHIGITHQSLRQVARAVERAVWEKNHG